MREKLKRLKECLDKQMLQKTKKQMIWYMIVSEIIFGIGMVLICLKLDGNSIIVCLLGVIYYIIILVVEGYFGHHQFLASLRDDERKKREMFQNGKRFSVVPNVLDIDKEIVATIEMNERKLLENYQYNFENANEYREVVKEMIKNNDIVLTAELIDDKICISIFCKGEIYYPEELKSSNLRWFEANFSVIK